MDGASATTNVSGERAGQSAAEPEPAFMDDILAATARLSPVDPPRFKN
jgi:hypothetical protein